MIKKYRIAVIKILSFFLVFYLSSACVSIKPASEKSGKNYVETFFVGEEGTQFFIKPIVFTCTESNEDIFLDFTFRFKDVIKDSATLNFSIEGTEMYRSIDSLRIFNDADTILCNQIFLMFNEKSRSGFASRHFAKFSLNELKAMFDNDSWGVTIYGQTAIRSFKPHKRTERAIKIVRDRVFVLM